MAWWPVSKHQSNWDLHGGKRRVGKWPRKFLQPWRAGTSVGAKRPGQVWEQHIPYVSSTSRERAPHQHWKQQAGRVREEHILWFLSSTLRFWSFLPREMWGGSKPHVVAVPTKWCLGDLSMLCENQSRPLLGLPCLLCGTKGFWSCDGWPRAVGQRGRSSLCLVTRLVAPASQKIFNAGLPRLANKPPDLDSQLQTPSVQ